MLERNGGIRLNERSESLVTGLEDRSQIAMIRAH